MKVATVIKPSTISSSLSIFFSSDNHSKIPRTMKVLKNHPASLARLSKNPATTGATKVVKPLPLSPSCLLDFTGLASVLIFSRRSFSIMELTFMLSEISLRITPILLSTEPIPLLDFTTFVAIIFADTVPSESSLLT